MRFLTSVGFLFSSPLRVSFVILFVNCQISLSLGLGVACAFVKGVTLFRVRRDTVSDGAPFATEVHW